MEAKPIIFTGTGTVMMRRAARETLLLEPVTVYNSFLIENNHCRATWPLKMFGRCRIERQQEVQLKFFFTCWRNDIVIHRLLIASTCKYRAHHSMIYDPGKSIEFRIVSHPYKDKKHNFKKKKNILIYQILQDIPSLKRTVRT